MSSGETQPAIDGSKELGAAGSTAPVNDNAPPKQPSPMELYSAYRDYVKHEDELLNKRLTSFLTFNSFLIGGSGVILAAMLSAYTKMDLPVGRLLALHLGGALAITILAWIGHDSARLATLSLKAATSSLRALRIMGNRRVMKDLAHLLPPVTDGRKLTPAQIRQAGRVHDIVSGFPLHVRRLWLSVLALAWAMVLVAVALNRGWIPAEIWDGPKNSEQITADVASQDQNGAAMFNTAVPHHQQPGGAPR